VEHLPQWRSRQPRVRQGLVETGDRPAVHLLVPAAAAVDPHHGRLVAAGAGVGGTLDQLPLPARVGATRVGGIDLNKPRARAILAAVLALAPAPAGFTVTDLAARVTAMTRHHGYTIRQAAYDLRKLRERT
jgi:hypothetical protein